MIRQVHIFYKGDLIFSHNYAIGLDSDELANVIEAIRSYIVAPMPGKTFNRQLGDKYQIFHRGAGAIYYLIITDLVDSLSYIDEILNKIIKKFKDFFPNIDNIKESINLNNDFLKFLNIAQQELHSKIVIVGPTNSGKTTLYKILKSGQERKIMNFAITSSLIIDDLQFDLWDFILKDNFSLLWSKFIGGSDLVILLIDITNYNLKTISHFLNIRKNEARFSKLLILANKVDLINSEEDIKRIKKEIDLPEIKEISLSNPKSIPIIINLIGDVLNLKKKLPLTFFQIKKEAESLDNQGKIIEAIIKYKELIRICTQYQDATYINSFQTRLEELIKIREKKVKEDKKLERKQKFKSPDQRKFSKKISVKSLPKVKTVLPPTPKKKKPQISQLKSEDVMLQLSSVVSSKPKAVSEAEKRLLIEDLIIKSKFDKAIQSLIEEKGSFLSDALCNKYVSNLQEALNRQLTFDDLNLAAETFLRLENLG